ncbi:MAG: TIGR00730 family Rossman fold protein [bacterium]
MNSICVYCGSNHGRRPEFTAAAQALGHELVNRGLGLVYGGGHVGLMGVLADAVLERGGTVTGVIPQALADKELGHRGVTELVVVAGMHERKAVMTAAADGFIALPGGLGTLEEFFEVLTWGQLGFHQKPVALFNVDGYFDPLLAFIDQAVADRFVLSDHRDMIIAADSPAEILEHMIGYQAPIRQKWIDPLASDEELPA